jgi:flagellar protein FliL
MSEATQLATEVGAEKPKKGGKGKLIILIGLAVLVLGGGAGGFLYWKSSQAHAANAAKKEKPIAKAPLEFLTLEPAFVVNFEAAQAAKFLQIEVRLASRDPEMVELLKHNDPLIRNDLLLLFGSQDYNQVATREGKDRLREQTLAAVRRIVQNEGGEPSKVEGAYFTSFVMQ